MVTDGPLKPTEENHGFFCPYCGDRWPVPTDPISEWSCTCRRCVIIRLDEGRLDLGITDPI